MKNYYDVVIIGSGPGGLGAAFYLSEHSDQSILMIDKLKVSSGGLHNDSKSNWNEIKIGFPLECWNQESMLEYSNEAKKHLKPIFSPQNNLDIYINRAKKYNTELVIADQCHVGTDRSVAMIKGLTDELESRKVDIELGKEVIELDYPNRQVTFKSGEVIKFKNLVLAIGRKGSTWLQEIMDQLNVKYIDNICDVGLRLETRSENYKVVQDYYDPKFWLPGDVRSFCSNSYHALVTKERYKDYYSINGHALSHDHKPNGLVNFAILKTVKLTNPITSGTQYGAFLGKMACAIGGGQPIMQRIGDLVAGKRSKKETFNDDLYDFKPTLPTAVPGDIRLAMPSKIWDDIWYALKTLDKIQPGVLHPQGILYYPEVKSYANKPEFIDEYFQIKENIYALGDGAGTSRGIVGAWASGARSAKGILS